MIKNIFFCSKFGINRSNIAGCKEVKKRKKLKLKSTRIFFLSNRKLLDPANSMPILSKACAVLLLLNDSAVIRTFNGEALLKINFIAYIFLELSKTKTKTYASERCTNIQKAEICNMNSLRWYRSFWATVVAIIIKQNVCPKIHNKFYFFHRDLTRYLFVCVSLYFFSM